jgi:threonine synthase
MTTRSAPVTVPPFPVISGAQVKATYPRASAVLILNDHDTVVLLVTGREVKAAGATNLGRVAVVGTLDEVERALVG